MTALQGRPAQVAQRDFEARVGLVTGGAGGLGSAICQRLRSAGATVVAADIRAPASAHGTEVLELDLTDADAAMNAPREVINRYSHLDFWTFNETVYGDVLQGSPIAGGNPGTGQGYTANFSAGGLAAGGGGGGGSLRTSAFSLDIKESFLGGGGA